MSGSSTSGPSARLEYEVARHLAKALGWTFVDLREYRVSCGVLRKVPAELACRFRCVPLVFNHLRTVLAVDDPWNAAYLAANPQLLGPPYRHRLEFALTIPCALDACLHRRLTVVRD